MNRRKRTSRRIASFRARLGGRESVAFSDRGRRVVLRVAGGTPLGFRVFVSPRGVDSPMRAGVV